ESYGWVAPGAVVSGLEEELLLSAGLPALLYVKEPAPGRAPRLAALLDRARAEGRATYRSFRTPDELARLLADDLDALVAQRYQAAPAASPATAVPAAAPAAAASSRPARPAATESSGSHAPGRATGVLRRRKLTGAA